MKSSTIPRSGEGTRIGESVLYFVRCAARVGTFVLLLVRAPTDSRTNIVSDQAYRPSWPEYPIGNRTSSL